MNKMLFAAVVAVCAAGCESMRPGPSEGYLNKDDDVFGRAETMEYTQKSRSVVRIIEQMKTDIMLTPQYDAARKRALAAGRARPTVASGADRTTSTPTTPTSPPPWCMPE